MRQMLNYMNYVIASVLTILVKTKLRFAGTYSTSLDLNYIKLSKVCPKNFLKIFRPELES